MKKKIMTMAMMALAFTACTEEDLMQPTQGDAGTLHIANVTIDGQQVARTRLVADDKEYIMSHLLPYNQSFNGFTEGDWLVLDINNLYAKDTQGGSIKATYNGIEGWSIDGYLRPSEDKTWADVGLKAGISVDRIMGETDKYSTHADNMGVVQGDIDESNSYIYGDWLTAETNNGTITIDTDVKSPTLGAVTIRLKHAHALLRLPQSAANVTPGTYIVNGTAHNVTGLGTLWAVLNTSSTSEGEDGTETTTSTTIYCPLTKVTIGEADFLQAIVPADTEGIYTLTGFKAVMLTEQSGASGEETTQNSELTTQNSLTLDLPFKVGTETSIELQSNYRYPLTLNIAPHTTSVTLSGELGKPGWGTDEVLSNEMNELLITVDGTQYIKLDGTATDVEKVKSIIETATAAGYTNFYVTGETLTTYYDGTAARIVVGEAIRLLTTDEEGNSDSQSPYCGRINLMLPAATAIGQSAFAGCTALASVSAPTATSILVSAFGSCTALTNVEFPKVERIFRNAFDGCTSLTYLTFGTKIKEVGSYAFGNPQENWSTKCALTLNIGQQKGTLVPNGNTWTYKTWASISYVNDDGNAVIDGTATKFATVKAQIETAINTRRSAIIVTGVTLAEYSDDNITDEANTVVGEAIRQLTLDSNGNPDANSSNKGTISLELPNVTSIGGKAFYNCDALTSLTFGSVITSMGTDAFNEVPTENCDLTLNSDQQDSTNYPVGTDGNGKPTWAGKTWASITLKVVTDK